METNQPSRPSATLRLTRAAIIAALYAAITLLIHPLAYGGVQCRISEALTILPLFFPEAIAGLGVGCLIANLFGNGILDIVFGTAATLIAAVMTFFAGKIKNTPLKLTLGLMPPVIVNAIVVPFTFLAITELEELYWINFLTVGVGQLLAVVALGIPLYFELDYLRKRHEIFR